MNNIKETHMPSEAMEILLSSIWNVMCKVI